MDLHWQWQLQVLSLVLALHLSRAQEEAAAQCLTSESLSCSTECFSRSQNSSTEIRLIPDLEFACNGTIVGFTVSGRLGEGSVDPKLQVWRRESSEDGYYSILGEIAINVTSSDCEEIAQLPGGSTFDCRVEESLQVTVESGLDIVGVELPSLEEQRFELFFTNGSQLQFVCSEELTENGTVWLNVCESVVTTDLLLLNIAVSTDASNCTTICEQNCTYTSGSFECSCHEGYILAEDGRSCVDTSMDACSEVTHNCQQRCVDAAVPGEGYSCECLEGYELRPDNATCNDIDECEHNYGDCQHKLCFNTNGSFACMCKDGYQLGDDGLSCYDIEECAENNDTCQHTCTNSEGSFQCSCLEGYTLNSDETNCTDINECTLGTHNCSQSTCVNTEGGFRCECEAGYKLDEDVNSCKDIDECTLGSHNCSQSTCVNTEGGFSCECEAGYLLDTDGVSCLKRGSESGSQGAAAGAAVTSLVVVIAIMSAIILSLFFLRRSKKSPSVTRRSHSQKRKAEHIISLPYLVENEGYTDSEGTTSPRGPRILVLNAPNHEEHQTNLEYYNSLFDEGDMNASHCDDTVIYNV